MRWRRLQGAFHQRLPSLVTCDFVALDALLEFAESGHGQTLRRSSLLHGQTMIALHRDVDRNVFLDLRVELGFSEGLLESWATREAFTLFSLLIDHDPPTWRAWLGYKNLVTGNDFKAPSRSAAAYLQLLAAAGDAITAGGSAGG
jgi:hypothetical protein